MIVCAMIIIQAKSAEQNPEVERGNDRERYRAIYSDPLNCFAKTQESFMDLAMVVLQSLNFVEEKVPNLGSLPCEKRLMESFTDFRTIWEESEKEADIVLSLEQLWVVAPEKMEMEAQEAENDTTLKQIFKYLLVWPHYESLEARQTKQVADLQEVLQNKPASMTGDDAWVVQTVSAHLTNYNIYAGCRRTVLSKLMDSVTQLRQECLNQNDLKFF
ncbi:MAG: hypothetical protein OXC30_05265 [Alphaproteobacteria bacterium]|nr:hypothetical protein [Alphaproteobacteria bacterium]